VLAKSCARQSDPRIFAVWRTPTVGAIEPQTLRGISMSLRRKIRSLVERHFVAPHLIRRAQRATADRPRTSGVLIMGWYGRETTGDKAILASLLHNIAGHSVRILKSTYDVDYSRQTLNEIEAPTVRCLPNDIASFLKALDGVDVVVIGGGRSRKAVKCSNGPCGWRLPKV